MKRNASQDHVPIALANAVAFARIDVMLANLVPLIPIAKMGFNVFKTYAPVVRMASNQGMKPASTVVHPYAIL
jgi:hypothetical protein